MADRDENAAKILIVDDVPENIDVLNIALTKAGYRVQAALDAGTALKIVTTGMAPDLILLDVMMPEMSGFDLCRELKATPATSQIPVIFVTAMNEVQDEKLGLEIGGVDYIRKPIRPEIVLARVHTHLTLKAAREKLERQNQELMEAARLREDVDRITRHDLKSPLNAIIGIPQLLLMEDNLSESVIEDLKLIEETGYRMLDMINSSLDLFKMEQGTYVFNPSAVELIDILNKIEMENSSVLKSKAVSIRMLANGETVETKSRFWVTGEKLLCYAMLSNLVKNAIEAAPQDSCVSIDCREDEQVRISIHNQGEVSAEVKDRFFDKYVTQGKNKGTGLGTYSAKLMAEAQNGKIEMTSSAEHGTRITITLLRASLSQPSIAKASYRAFEMEDKGAEQDDVRVADLKLLRKSVDPSQMEILLPLLKHLETALQEMDPVNVQSAMDELSLFFNPAILSKITAMIKRYDYEEAFETIAGLLAQLNSALDKTRII